MMPVTFKLVSVPTEVIFGCAAVPMVPVTLVPCILVALNSAALIVPVTDNPVNAPKELMLGCAPVPNVPVMVVALTEPALSVPVTVKAEKLPLLPVIWASVPGDKVPLNVPPAIVPDTLRLVRFAVVPLILTAFNSAALA